MNDRWHRLEQHAGVAFLALVTVGKERLQLALSGFVVFFLYRDGAWGAR